MNLSQWRMSLCILILCSICLMPQKRWCQLTVYLPIYISIYCSCRSVSRDPLLCSHQNAQQNINTGLFIRDMASLFWCRAHPLILSPGWRGLWTALGQWSHLTCRIFDPHKLPLWERPSHMKRRGEESRGERDKWIDRRQMTPKTEWMEKGQYWE